jgi:lambda repressor-like predicted transcriptional regulator
MIKKGRGPRGEKSSQSKLTNATVLEVRERYARGGVSIRSLAKEKGLSVSSMFDVLNKTHWKHLNVDSNPPQDTRELV